jgi:hydroxymethylbilane synthase
MRKKIIIGARGSLLSVAQAESVIKLLKSKFPSYSFCLKKITTSGDKKKNWQRFDVGIFVKEIEDALLCGKIDIAVHSMKDLPTQLPLGLKLAAAVKREDPRDCLISKDKIPFTKLKIGACVGTSSLRRQVSLLRSRQDLRIKPLRGNLDTRIRKLEEGEFDAIVVAMAGLKRLGLKKKLFIQPIPPSIVLPAAGQGALALEIRSTDKLAQVLTQRVNDKKVFLCIFCERAFLREYGGGCQLPLGVLAEIRKNRLHLRVMAASIDGKKMIRLSRSAAINQGELLGKVLAKAMLKKGARQGFSR